MTNAGHDNSEMPLACLICAPTEEAAERKAQELAAAAVCRGEGRRPCGVCRDCRKAASGVHPDILAIGRLTDEKGKRKQAITVEQIRALSADAVVLPNEARRKVYIIQEAETMNSSAQNAALKLLEEPPADALFLLCTIRPMLLLATVRSRCATVNVAGEEADDTEAAGLAAAYIKAVNSRDAAKILRWCALNEGLEPQGMEAFLEALRARLSDLLSCRLRGGRLSRAELLHLYRLSERCTQYLKVNANVKHLFGLLAVDALPDGNRGKTDSWK